MTGTEVIGNNNNFVGWAAAALKWMKLLHRRGWLFANEAFVSERCYQRLVYIVDHHRPSTKDPSAAHQQRLNQNPIQGQASIPPGPPHHVTILRMHTTHSNTQ